jgi:hypothetical protein
MLHRDGQPTLATNAPAQTPHDSLSRVPQAKRICLLYHTGYRGRQGQISESSDQQQTINNLRKLQPLRRGILERGGRPPAHVRRFERESRISIPSTGLISRMQNQPPACGSHLLHIVVLVLGTAFALVNVIFCSLARFDQLLTHIIEPPEYSNTQHNPSLLLLPSHLVDSSTGNGRSNVQDANRKSDIDRLFAYRQDLACLLCFISSI